MRTVVTMTVTEERPAHRAGPGGDEPDDSVVSSGERIAWFSGGFIAAVHLVVLIALGVLAFGSDALDLRRRANDPIVRTESVFVATEFAFDPSAASATDGQLTITMINRGAIIHNLLIEGIPGFVVEADAGATSSADVSLGDGVFTLYCSVPGHREAGMEATLNVEAG